jgi:aminoglycoside 6-adenylyltransferase
VDINATTLDTLAEWAAGREDVRALILTSTRAIAGARVDAYSDFDVIVIVDDVRGMLGDTTWQAEFGEVLIAYWDPLEVDSATGADWVSNITNYTNGLKIDFNLWSQQRYIDVTAGPNPYPEFDAGYQIIVDKDDLTADLPAPTAYIPARPDETTYLRLITDFLIGVPYVAKGLLRDELLPTKWVLDFDMRFNYLLPLLEWRVECDHDWTMRTGNLGKGLKAHLTTDIASHLERTFSGATPEANWTALFEMIKLFGRVAREVADRLGYQYPEDLVTAVTDHARRMRDGVFASGPLQAE